MRRVLGLVMLASVGVLAACAPTTGVATTHPVISAITATPNPVAQGGALTISWHLSDSASVVATTLVVRSTTTQATIIGCSSTIHRTAGTVLDGDYGATCTVPALQPSGTYLIDVGALDSNGGSTENITSTFTVSGTAGDTSAPAVVSSSLGLSSSGSNAVVTVTMHVTDDSGVAALPLTLQNPSSHTVVGIGTASLTTGTSTDGTYFGTITVLTGTPAGQYNVVVGAADVIGNSATTVVGTIGLS
jgi:hypothetical protein